MTETKNTKPFYNTKIPSDWEVKELGEIAFVNMGQSPDSDNYNESGEGLPLIQGNTDMKNRKSFIRYFTTQLTKVCNEGDLILSVRAPVGNIGEATFKSCIGRGVCAIKPKKIDKEYLFQLLIYCEEKWRKIEQGSTFTAVSSEDVRKFKLVISKSETEQKAIARVLSTWDEAIHKTEQLIIQKELRKKWLMQNLLTGKMRLKGFEGEWKEIHLGSLGNTYSGLTGKNKEDFGEGKPYIPYLNIFKNARIDISNFDYVKITEMDNQNRVKYGDIFFTVSSETPDEVGMASVMLDEIDELYLNSFCFGFRLIDFNTLVPEFSSYFLRAKTFRTEINKLSQGATRFNLSKNNLMKLNIILPPIEEQTSIAQVLQAADKEINLLKAKVEKLKEQKKGLMQVLLTGKVRIKIDNL